MLALLAANSYHGIEDVNLQHFYWLLCALAMLAVCLVGFRLIGFLRPSARKRHLGLHCDYSQKFGI